MQRERISENVYWFQSEVYALVTAGVIIGPQWAVVVDTLALPDETLALRKFIAEDLGVPIRYVINTHHHADHAWGNCFFPNATIIAHSNCAEYLRTKGTQDLASTQRVNTAFQNSRIVLPHLTFAHGEMTLKIGKKNISILTTPGHSTDSLSVFVEEDRILFAGDAFMPIPQIDEGGYHDTLSLYRKVESMGLENIVQGHGEIILRGEIEDAIAENTNYVQKLVEYCVKARVKPRPGDFLSFVSIESCGKNRVHLGGIAEQIHKRNLVSVFKTIITEFGLPKPEEIETDPDDDFDDLLNMESFSAADGDEEEEYYPVDDEFDEED